MEITLPNGTVAKYPLERLTRLYDTLEQLEDLWGEGSAQDDLENDPVHDHDTEVWAMDEDGVWQAQANGDENEEWEETDEDDEDYDMDVEGDAQMDDIHTPDNEVHTSWWDHIVPTVTPVPTDQQDTLHRSLKTHHLLYDRHPPTYPEMLLRKRMYWSMEPS